MTDQHSTPADTQNLSSWKEIASYLGVSVRTAQTWERERGLPVRRLPGAGGRVFVGVPELEAWRRGPEESEISAKRPARRVPRTAVWIALAGSALALSAILFLTFRTARQPGYAQILPNALVVFDQEGRELWRKGFPALNNLPGIVLAAVADVDSDGSREVLFAPLPAEPGSASTPLVCYSAAGRERWRWKPGRAVRTAREEFTDLYNIRCVRTVRQHGETRVVVSSVQDPYCPCQVALLSGKGELLGEYWHSGSLSHMLVADFDKDGTEEIYLGGVNNATRSAEIVVLDPDHVDGASVEGPADYQLLGFRPAAEKARVLLPRSCLTRLSRVFNSVQSLQVEGSQLVAGVRESAPGGRSGDLFYHFDPGMRLRAVRIGSTFLATHERLARSGELDHPFSEREQSEFRHLTWLKGAPETPPVDPAGRTP